MKKKSLITGGAGFIGSHVTDDLIKMGHEVTIIDDLSGGFEENINLKATFIKGSINNLTLLENVFAKYHFDYVFHLAAYAAEGLSHFIRKYNYENNLIGSVNLINKAIKYKVKHFVFTSSIAVYGANQLPMKEDMIPKPDDPYGIAKYAVELDLRSANKMFGLDYTIFRPHNVYGERQNLSDPYRNVIGIFINQILNHKPLTIFDDGKQTRAFSYINDVAPYIAKSIVMAGAKNEVINIGADEPIDLLSLAKLIAKIMNTKLMFKFLPPRKEVVHAYANHSKAKAIFNIKKTTSIEKGIGKMAKWALENGSRKIKKFARIEVEKNMPQIWKSYLNNNEDTIY